jgi:3-hydroxyisobutyrate dehydrogenase
MGMPLARRLREAGADLALHDRDPARAAELGGDDAGSPAAVAQGASLVFTMVPDDAALVGVVTGAEGLAGALSAGQVLVDMGTVSPSASARVAAALAPGGAGFLRCPVSGSTATAAAGRLTLFVSGPAGALAQAAPARDVLGSQRLHVGAAEEARALKLLVNMVVAATPALLGEALAFGRRLGLDWSTMVDALGASVVASPLLAYKMEMMKARDWTPAASIDLLAKDLDLALDAARDAHVPVAITALVRQQMAALQAAGEGQLDFFRLLTFPER